MDSHKASVTHVDDIDAPTGIDSDQSSLKHQHNEKHVDDVDEEIVHHLQNTGEEVGMTWRSTMAAASMAMCYSAYLFTLLVPPAILSYINADLGPDPRFTWITISVSLLA